MTVSLKHTFVSAIADSADASLVQPSSWNAEHTLTLGANVLLGAVTAGAAQEIGLGAGLSFSGGNLVVSGFAASSHSHVIADVTGLQSALDGKQASGDYSLTGHSHVVADITGLQGQLDGKAATGHSHIIADVTGLQAALDGKQVAGSYQPLATVLTNTTAAFTTTLEAKLSGVATGATANSSDATLLDRANHTGSQAAATISDFNAAARAQTEAELVAGANVTITPSGSGATRQLTIAASSGGATYGTATIDFGAFPGGNEATVAFADASVPSGAKIQAFIASDATTADHTANDHKYAPLFIHLTAQPDAGVGGNIFARSHEKMQGQWAVRYQWAA